jgi:hypothetical protein
MSTRNLPGGKGRPAPKADNLAAICEPIVQIMWDTQRLINLWASMASYRDSFTFMWTYRIIYVLEAQISLRSESGRLKRVIASCHSIVQGE